MSTDRLIVRLDNIARGHEEILRAWKWAKAYMGEHSKPLIVEIRKSTRTLEQNSILWSILTDLAEQVRWPVNGTLRFLEDEEWKDILTAGLKSEQQMAAGINGGFIMLGQRTSKMTKGELSELMELAWAFGAEREVKWSRTSLGRDVPDEAMA